MTISRKGFLAAAAVATSAAAVANVVPANAADNTAPAAAMPAPSGRAPLHFHVLKQSEYDHAAMSRQPLTGWPRASDWATRGNVK